ncbi:hypothetical protein MRX96_043421 [Rhipicephalus microplus]
MRIGAVRRIIFNKSEQTYTVSSTSQVRVQTQDQNAHFLRRSPRAGDEDADRDIADVLPFRPPALGDGRSRCCCLQSDALSLGKVASVLGCFVGAALSPRQVTAAVVTAFLLLHCFLVFSRLLFGDLRLCQRTPRALKLSA